jgi:hypothetical protein
MKYLKFAILAAAVFSLSLAAQESVTDGATEKEEGPAIEELSQEELDAEMERVEKALGEVGELKEFIPTKPLAADLPVALPSDI